MRGAETQARIGRIRNECVCFIPLIEQHAVGVSRPCSSNTQATVRTALEGRVSRLNRNRRGSFTTSVKAALVDVTGGVVGNADVVTTLRVRGFNTDQRQRRGG